MNPARLHALFNARFLPEQKQAQLVKQEQRSLREYLMGGS